MSRYAFPLILGVVFLLVGLIGYNMEKGAGNNSLPPGATLPPGSKTSAPVALGQIAPDFELLTLDGGRMSLADQRGKIVLINFWATWCPPCREEMPVLEEYYHQQQSQVTILAVDIMQGETINGIKEFINSGGYTFPVLLDDAGQVAAQYRVTGIPTTYFVDPQGVIRDYKIGPLTMPELEARVKRIQQL